MADALDPANASKATLKLENVCKLPFPIGGTFRELTLDWKNMVDREAGRSDRNREEVPEVLGGWPCV